MPDVPGVLSADELAVLPHAELAERLAAAYRLIAELTARVEQLERQVRRDSSTSSKPPSSDSPYEKKPRDRSLRERRKRRPGKQLPAHVRARAGYGPEAHAQAANLTVGHHVPACRAALLLCQFAGLRVSTGWMAGIRGRPPPWPGAAGSRNGSGSC